MPYCPLLRFYSQAVYLEIDKIYNPFIFYIKGKHDEIRNKNPRWI